MDRLGRKIYTNARGYEVYVVLMQECVSTRISIRFYTVSPMGVMSDIVSVQRQDILRKKNPLDFFLNLEGGFGLDDILNINEAVKNMMKNWEEVDIRVQEKYTMSGLHQAFSDFIREHAKDDNSEDGIFIKNGYGYLPTDKMQEFVRNNKELGYKRVDILERLKIMGVLDSNQNRYDKLVSIGGTKKRFYKIVLAEETNEEKADEVIEE